MKEIDLKVTPLSEIDLSRIDYEKSYVEYDGKINSIKTIKANFIEERWEVDYWWFTNQGKHIIRPSTITLHLFYKEVKSCYMCRYLSGSRYVDPCYSCANIGRSDKDNWLPKESPKPKTVKSNPHPIVIEYQDLGDTVKIVKIEGVMTHEEILRHAGHSIAEMYFGHGLCMWKTGNILTVENGSETFSCKLKQIMKIGDKIEKEMFFIAIDKMERSAKRLASLIKESKPKIERIEI